MPTRKIHRKLTGFLGNYTTYRRIGTTANFISATACRMNPFTLKFERETITYKEAIKRGYEPVYSN